jgi:tetratricopeptide (TPR) repeat protein
LGICYQSKSQTDAALREFNVALQRDAASAAAWYYRGSLYADRNDLPRAERDARKSLALDKANPPTRVLLAKVWLRSGKCAQAADILRPITGAAGANTDALFQLARAYECLKQDQQAQAVRKRFAELSNQQQTAHTAQEEAKHLAEQAGEAARQNQLAPAMNLLQQALAKDPESGPAHALLAKIYFSQGALPKARAEVEAALRSNPYHPDYLYVLGRVLEKQGDPQGALQSFQKVALVNPRESDAYYEMAQIHLQSGQRQQALAALREAVRLSPDDPDYRRALDAMLGSQKATPQP